MEILLGEILIIEGELSLKHLSNNGTQLKQKSFPAVKKLNADNTGNLDDDGTRSLLYGARVKRNVTFLLIK